MNIDLKKLSKVDLVKLKENIELEILEKIKEGEKPNKDTILSLKRHDKIFGIRLSYQDDFSNVVEVIGDCIINDVIIYENSDDVRFNVGTEDNNKRFGFITTLSKKTFTNKHCILFLGDSKNHSDAFYTLKPKTWKEDLKKQYLELVERQKELSNEKLNIFEKKITMFLEGEEKINQAI